MKFDGKTAEEWMKNASVEKCGAGFYRVYCGNHPVQRGYSSTYDQAFLCFLDTDVSICINGDANRKLQRFEEESLSM